MGGSASARGSKALALPRSGRKSPNCARDRPTSPNGATIKTHTDQPTLRLVAPAGSLRRHAQKSRPGLPRRLPRDGPPLFARLLAGERLLPDVHRQEDRRTPPVHLII